MSCTVALYMSCTVAMAMSAMGLKLEVFRFFFAYYTQKQMQNKCVHDLHVLCRVLHMFICIAQTAADVGDIPT